jgi:hypothetical protein
VFCGPRRRGLTPGGEGGSRSQSTIAVYSREIRSVQPYVRVIRELLLWCSERVKRLINYLFILGRGFLGCGEKRLHDSPEIIPQMSGLLALYTLHVFHYIVATRGWHL